MAGSLTNTRAIRTPVNPTRGAHVGHPSDIISDMASKKNPLLSPWYGSLEDVGAPVGNSLFARVENLKQEGKAETSCVCKSARGSVKRTQFQNAPRFQL